MCLPSSLTSTTSSTTLPFQVSRKRDSGISTSFHSPFLQQRGRGQSGLRPRQACNPTFCNREAQFHCVPRTCHKRLQGSTIRGSYVTIGGQGKRANERGSAGLAASSTPLTAQRGRLATHHGCARQPASSHSAHSQCTAVRRRAPCSAGRQGSAGRAREPLASSAGKLVGVDHTNRIALDLQYPTCRLPPSNALVLEVVPHA